VVQDELQRFTLNHEQAFVTVLPCLLPRLKNQHEHSYDHRNDGHIRG
jgi:hypothetical protein